MVHDILLSGPFTIGQTLTGGLHTGTFSLPSERVAIAKFGREKEQSVPRGIKRWWLLCLVTFESAAKHLLLTFLPRMEHFLHDLKL